MFAGLLSLRRYYSANPAVSQMRDWCVLVCYVSGNGSYSSSDARERS